ncbi:MAG TPA: glycosyltransferase family 39 protein [Candidatus Methylomirabilis sp.]
MTRRKEAARVDRSSWKTLLLASVPLAVLAAGFALRIYHLGESSVWIDEANTVRIARMGFADMIGALSRDSSPPLYYLLLRSWMFLLGEGPIAIRLLSVLFGVILIGSVFVVGRRFFSYRTGVVAAILMAVAPAQILHSQQCRMYTLLPLLALGAWHCLRNAADTGSRAWVAGWIACMIAAVYTHHYGWFLFPACLWILWSHGELRRRPMRWIGAAAMIGVAYLPWSPFFWQQLHISAQNSWYQPIWDALGPQGDLLATLDSFSGGRRSLSFAWAEPDAFRIPRLLLLVATSAWALFRIFRRDGDPGTKRNAGDVLAFLMIPLIALITISMVASPVYRFGRSDQLVFPAFILLTAACVTAFRRPAVVVALTAFLAMFSLANYPPVTVHASMRSSADVAGTILGLARPGDAVLSTSLTAGPLEYYARQAGVRLPIITFPRDDIGHPAIQDQAAWLATPGALEHEAGAAVDDACRAAGPGGRFFAVLGIEAFNRPLLRALARRDGSRLVILPGERRIPVTSTPVRLLVVTCA